jgi:hypothetical protein
VPRRLARSALLGALLGGLAAVTADAQLGYFGQNKVQYRDFEWRVLRGEHVDLYFYPEEAELAALALTYAEESFTILERKFGHTPHRRIPLIIYALHQDFEQTNILPFIPPEGILGVTEFLKRRIAVPFRGNYAEFRHTLRHEMVHAFQLSVVTEVRTRFPRSRLPPLPLWWSEGLAEFWSGGQDALDETVMLDLTVSGRMPRLRALEYVTGGAAYPIGGAIHRWLAQHYGDWRVQMLYRDLWKYRTFHDALAAIYGVPIEELENDLHYYFQQTYYPEVTDRVPLEVNAGHLTSVAVKPVAYRLPDDSVTRYLFLSPSTGYMNLYSGRWDAPDARSVVVKGQRSAEFESFHASASRLDVHEGVVAFSSRYLERDALFLFDLRQRRVVGRYEFENLSSILSPEWDPEGQSVVFSGLTSSGYSDLYRLWFTEGRLERLTDDRYQDIDPSFSPDGGQVVFASDRTAFGADGALNLFLLDVAGGRPRHLTYGPWQDLNPRWGPDGLIYFVSDRVGSIDAYRVDSTGSGHRITNTLTAVFDPQWLPHENALLFTGWSDLTFKIFRTRLDSAVTDSTTAISLPDAITGPDWSWPELRDPEYSPADARPYKPGLRLDFVFGDALIAPGIGTAQGFVFQFSDLLSDHLLYATLGSFSGGGFGSVFDNVNASLFYLNRTNRLNWGVGAFRLKGLFSAADLGTLYQETSYGGFAEVRWPFSRYKRVVGQLRVEHSDRFDFGSFIEDGQQRVGWLASNFVSYVHDNALWLPSGPVDGSRTNITGGVINDLTNGRFDAWQVSLDHRRYVRLGLRTAYAIRGIGYYAGGSRPRRIAIGGTWGLRGYPRVGNVGGEQAFLLNQELRFPLTSHVTLGFPFGDIQFPGIQGALFVDLGGAWNDPSIGRSVIGSGGFGFRLPLGFALVLRLDMGWRFAFGETFGYAIPPPSENRWFTDFFFGFNY